MTDPEDDVADLVHSIFAEEHEPLTDAEAEATLADPTFAALTAEALAPYDRVLTPAAKALARRTLATVLAKDPRAIALLDRVRAAGPRDASATVEKRGPSPGSKATPRRRTKP